MPSSELSPRTFAPEVFDEYRQDIYLDAIRQGVSATSAARKAGLSPAAVRRAISLSPQLADRERQAAAEALGKVEDAMFRLALGDPSPQEVQYHEDLKAYREELDLPEPEPLRPPTPSLKAQETILSRLDRKKWSPNPDVPHTVNVQMLTTPEGAAAFRAQLEERRQATLPEYGSHVPVDATVVDAEVVDAEDPPP